MHVCSAKAIKHPPSFTPHPAAAFFISPNLMTFSFFITSTTCFTLCFVFNLVAPPQDLQITDPGLLGSLDIEWKPPPNVQTFNECTVKYKFEYRNTGDREWKVSERSLLLLYCYCSAFISHAGLCLPLREQQDSGKTAVPASHGKGRLRSIGPVL